MIIRSQFLKYIVHDLNSVYMIAGRVGTFELEVAYAIDKGLSCARDNRSRKSASSRDCVQLAVVARLPESAIVDVFRHAVIRGPESTFHLRSVVTATPFEEIR